MLKVLNGRLSLHMPGHRGQLDGFDTTELPVTDDLYEPFNGILKAEKAMAISARAGASVFLVGGSTAGVQSMMLTYLKPGDTIILPRNAHNSAISACGLGGFNAIFVPLSMDEAGYTYIKKEAYLAAIEENPGAKAILVTRPDYYGGMVELEHIARAAHKIGMKLIVDEAHGAHLNWMPGMQTAGDAGADAWVQSFHKTLLALNSAAVMHFRNAEDGAMARGRSRLIQTSSPSFPVLASIDKARGYMDEQGEQRLVELVKAIDAFCLKAAKLGYQDVRREDPTRLVLAAPQGGQTLARQLEAQGIDVEMADERRIVGIMTVADDPMVFHRLYEALKQIPIEPKAFALRQLPKPPVRKCSIREAIFAKREAVPLEKAAGRVAATTFGLYPPGIPLVSPGEMVTKDIWVSCASGNTFGVENGAIQCIVEEI